MLSNSSVIWSSSRMICTGHWHTMVKMKGELTSFATLTKKEIYWNYDIEFSLTQKSCSNIDTVWLHVLIVPPWPWQNERSHEKRNIPITMKKSTNQDASASNNATIKSPILAVRITRQNGAKVIASSPRKKTAPNQPQQIVVILAPIATQSIQVPSWVTTVIGGIKEI